jgi:hypothetical protein
MATERAAHEKEGQLLRFFFPLVFSFPFNFSPAYFSVVFIAAADATAASASAAATAAAAGAHHTKLLLQPAKGFLGENLFLVARCEHTQKIGP